MQNIEITRTKTTVSAPYLPYAAYKSALEIATALKGKIGKTDKGFFQATFSSAKVAEEFVTMWTAMYHAARKYEPTSAQKPKASKSKTETKPTASSTKKTTKKTASKKPTASKGNAIDFTQFKGTKSEKNRALHAMLVGKGITNSKSAEYQAVWNARPWAK
jgi:hypothetical protein